MAKFSKEVALKMLGDVPPENNFWCIDGRVLKNLPETVAALKEMTDETFRQHVNEEKNDFANWVRDVIGDEKLSLDLRQSKTRAEAARVISNRIAWLKGRAK